MLMENQFHDYVAWAIALGATGLFIVLLCWHGYTEYREEERLRSARKEQRHD